MKYTGKDSDIMCDVNMLNRHIYLASKSTVQASYRRTLIETGQRFLAQALNKLQARDREWVEENSEQIVADIDAIIAIRRELFPEVPGAPKRELENIRRTNEELNHLRRELTSRSDFNWESLAVHIALFGAATAISVGSLCAASIAGIFALGTSHVSVPAMAIGGGIGAGGGAVLGSVAGYAHHQLNRP